MARFLSAVGVCVLAAALLAGAAHAANPVANVPSSAVVPLSAEQVRLSFAPVVRTVAPAVVNIYTKTVVKQRYFAHPLFQQFFGDMVPPGGVLRERVQNSLGSGVLVSANGLVVTANHVIDGATEVRVALHDRREFSARVITQDTRTDLAVLRIETKDPLPFLPLADSDSLQVGDLVLAIGNPFGVGQTVTSGIISAVARSNVGISDYNYFVQTDAAINPGNSGGALVTMDGRLAGINSAIFSKDGGSLGIGFAIPAAMVERIVEAGSAGAARVVRPWLGIYAQPVTPDLAESLGLERPAGVLVNGLADASPARKAGLRKGDVITAFNGRAVDDPEAVKFRAGSERVGGAAVLAVTRDGQAHEVSIDLVPPPEVPLRDLTVVPEGGHPLAGATIANLSPAVVEEYDLDVMDAHGVVVLEPKRRGIVVGDRIMVIDGQPVDTVDDVVRLLRRQQREGGGRTELVLERGGETVRLVMAR